MAKKGYTLVELVIVTVMISVLAGIFLHLAAAGFNSWFLIAERRALVEQARLIMNHAVRNIRGDFARGRYHNGADYESTSGAPNVGRDEIAFSRVSDPDGTEPLVGDADGLYATGVSPPWDYEASVRYDMNNVSTDPKLVQWNWREAAAWQSRYLADLLTDTGFGTTYFPFKYYGDSDNDGDYEEILPNSEGSTMLSDNLIREVETIEINIFNETADKSRSLVTKTLIFPRNEGRPKRWP